MSRSYIRFTAYFLVVAISAVDAKETIERELESISPVTYIFHGFSREKNTDYYTVRFLITVVDKGIDYRENLDDVMDKLAKAGYFSGMALEEQKGENYAGKRSYFYKR